MDMINVLIDVSLIIVFRKLNIALILLILSAVLGKLEIALSALSLLLFPRFNEARSLIIFLFRGNRIQRLDGDDNAAISTCAGSSIGEGEYEVFLSFHGGDTRKGFTDVLYTFLIVAGVWTYRDNEELRVGKRISDELLKAIKQSRISVPIFSKNYASSKWCMLEYAQMVECMEKEGQQIFPIFYDVEPHEVRHQTGSYRMAFWKHRLRFGKDTIQQWKYALNKVGEMKGLELKKATDGYQGKLAEMAVKKILQMLKKNKRDLPEFLIGKEHYEEKMEELLDLNSNSLRIVGIHGMGGIGKTTIAKIIYNKLSDRSYEPPLLNPDHSLQLFSYHAFMQPFPLENFAALAWDIASTAAGLPLALEDIGSSLINTRNRVSWNEKLSNVEKNPGKKVSETLRSCYEGLENHQERCIFLDTACLFIREDCTVPSYMWTDCQHGPINAIKANVLKSLIKIKDDNKLWMHDKLRDIGRQIVHEESNHPGERSRLWCCKEALHVFDGEMGTNKVVALCLDFDEKQCESRSGRLVREDFGDLRNLKFLRVGPTDFQGDFKRLFSGLRWLQWKALGKISPETCDLLNLVILDLSGSGIMDDWEAWTQIKKSTKLKVLNLSNCIYLRRGPDFSAFESLERLILSSCHSLDKVEPSIGKLINLRVLDLSNCLGLGEAPDFSQIPTLEYLDVHSYPQLSGLSGFEYLVKLRYLNTSDCLGLTSLPDLSHLSKLKKLITSKCNKLNELQGLDSLESLEHLDTSGCISLRSLPNVSNLVNLKKIILSGCKNLAKVKGIMELESLEHLDISGCISFRSLPSISNLVKLKEITLSGCRNLAEVEGIRELKSLEALDVSWCTLQKNIPDLSNFKNLKKLKLGGFKDLTEIWGLEELKSLELLNISGWESIENLPHLSDLKMLKEINASDCVKLTGIWGFEELKFFELLDIAGCKSIEELPDLSNLRRLKEINASECVKLSAIRGLEELESLIWVNIRGCTLLTLGPHNHHPFTTIIRDF
ncbi:hypothetical protein LguiB_010639 [Lonicera macranthoides]